MQHTGCLSSIGDSTCTPYIELRRVNTSAGTPCRVGSQGALVIGSAEKKLPNPKGRLPLLRRVEPKILGHDSPYHAPPRIPSFASSVHQHAQGHGVLEECLGSFLKCPPSLSHRLWRAAPTLNRPPTCPSSPPRSRPSCPSSCWLSSRPTTRCGRRPRGISTPTGRSQDRKCSSWVSSSRLPAPARPTPGYPRLLVPCCRVWADVSFPARYAPLPPSYSGASRQRPGSRTRARPSTCSFP